MALSDLTDWLEAYARPGFLWYAKRLSGNDTLANQTHQAGPYIPKDILFKVFPSLHRKEARNPDKWFKVEIDSHNDDRLVRAIWYNNKFHGGTRNEARLTNFGGISSALLDPENTGALALFVFNFPRSVEAEECHAWVCRNEIEEAIVEDQLGPVEPGQLLTWSVDASGDPTHPGRSSCWLDAEEIPSAWLSKFPTGQEIIQKALELRPAGSLHPDDRLLRRRACEFEIFRSLEEAIEMPVISRGFDNIEDFLTRAQSILQRRKSRSGRSLELHTKQVFLEEDLIEGSDFSHQPESEGGKRPDFLFPSEAAYKNPGFPVDKLRMLAVKTTCKDRWRQVASEANRIQTKHLLTIQEGVSENQFREMESEGVALVVPRSLMNSYPQAVRPHLLSFEAFIRNIKDLRTNE